MRYRGNILKNILDTKMGKKADSVVTLIIISYKTKVGEEILKKNKIYIEQGLDDSFTRYNEVFKETLSVWLLGKKRKTLTEEFLTDIIQELEGAIEENNARALLDMKKERIVKVAIRTMNVFTECFIERDGDTLLKARARVGL